MAIEDAVQPPAIVEPDKTSLRQSLPAFVWLTAFATLAVVILGTLILPQLRIPDEKHHADMVLMVQEGEWLERGWPGIGDRLLDPAIVDASLSLGPREAALRENRAAQHPPLFYVTAAVTSSLATVTVDDPDLVLDLWSYRLVSVVATALLPITFYLIASELTVNRWIRLASAVVPLGVPGITLRDGSMVNTDALLVVLASLAILFAVRITKGDSSRRTGLFLGLATGLAALTKGHALVLLPVILLAYSIQATRNRRITREWLQSVALFSVVTLLAGGWWWFRNIFLHGAVQPVRHLEPVTEPIVFDWLTFDWTAWFTEATPRMVSSYWGGQFALGGRPYVPLFWTLTILLAIGWVVGWARARDRVTASVSAMYAVLLIPAVLLTSAFLTAERGKVVGVHGRYFFPGLAGIVPLVVGALAGMSRRVHRWLPTLFVTGSVVMTLLAVHYMLTRYWGSLGPAWADRWAAVVASSPFPAGPTNGILVVAAGALVVLLVSALRLGVRGDLATDPAQ